MGKAGRVYKSDRVVTAHSCDGKSYRYNLVNDQRRFHVVIHCTRRSVVTSNALTCSTAHVEPYEHSQHGHIMEEHQTIPIDPNEHKFQTSALLKEQLS